MGGKLLTLAREITSSETQGQSVSKGAVFKISNAERSEAESVDVEGRLTGLHT